MAEIDVTDRVRISKVDDDQDPSWLNRVGMVVMIADGVRCVVAFPDGSAATVGVDQLTKVG